MARQAAGKVLRPRRNVIPAISANCPVAPRRHLQTCSCSDVILPVFHLLTSRTGHLDHAAASDQRARTRLPVELQNKQLFHKARQTCFICIKKLELQTYYFIYLCNYGILGFSDICPTRYTIRPMTSPIGVCARAGGCGQKTTPRVDCAALTLKQWRMWCCTALPSPPRCGRDC